MRIVHYEEKDRESWNRFVEKSPGGTFFHRAEWIAITESYYGFSSYSFSVREGNEIVAVIPLFLCKSPFLGKCLIPTPTCGRLNYCLSNDEAEPIIWAEMERLLRDTDARFVEMRFDYENSKSGLVIQQEHILQPLFLEQSADEQWKKIKPSVRNKIRQAERYNLRCFSGKSEYFPDFYRLYATNMRNFAYPLLGKKMFRLLLHEFSDIMEFIVLKYEECIIAALINFYYKDTVTNLWGVSSLQHRHLRINNYLYWEALTKAVTEGYKSYDFGRSRKDSGIFVFKSQWGTTNIPLHYHYLVKGETQLPSVEGTQNRYRLPMMIWRHLPLGITKTIGPPLGKWMPL